MNSNHRVGALIEGLRNLLWNETVFSPAKNSGTPN